MTRENCTLVPTDKLKEMQLEIEALRKDAERLTTKNLEWLAQWNEDQETITSLRAENEILRKDAERLDWLDKHNETYAITVDVDCFWYIRRKTDKSCVGRPFIRGAIDAAMKGVE